VHYVAGTSPRTVTGIEIVDGHVVLKCTTEGDGRVTYESGAFGRTNVVHGGGAWRPGGAPAELPRAAGSPRDRHDVPSVDRPQASRGGAVRYLAPPEPVLYPTESSLAAGMFGKTPRRPYQRRAASPKRIHATALRALSIVTRTTGDTTIAPRITSTSVSGGCHAIRSVSTRASWLPGGDPAQAHRSARRRACPCDRHRPGQVG
jgi:hypothetical protein